MDFSICLELADVQQPGAQDTLLIGLTVCIWTLFFKTGCAFSDLLLFLFLYDLVALLFVFTCSAFSCLLVISFVKKQLFFVHQLVVFFVAFTSFIEKISQSSSLFFSTPPHTPHFFLHIKRNPRKSEGLWWLHKQCSKRRKRFMGISDNHRITKWLILEWLRVEGSSGGHLVHPRCWSRLTGPCPSRFCLSPRRGRLHRPSGYLSHSGKVQAKMIQFPGFGTKIFPPKVKNSCHTMVSI